MRVLLLTQVLPHPPDSGPKVKTWNVLKHLAQRHRVTLVSFVRGDQSADTRHLERYCDAVHSVPITRHVGRDAWDLARSWVSRRSFLMTRDDRATMRHLVDRVASATGFDVVHADQLNMAQYAARVSGVPKILDAHNALWLLYRQLWQLMPPGPTKWVLGRDWQLLKTYEGAVCRRFDATLAVSESDKRWLEEAGGPSSRVTVVPIAVDPDELAPVHRRHGAGHILHLGTMYWPPNVDGVRWFVREVLPRIRTQRPDAVFDVVGAHPPRRVLAAGKGTAVNVTGYVADPTPYLEAASLAVVPLRAGSGMRVKILTALAQGLPVVSTSIGCDGIAVEDGRHLLIADTAEAFAAATLRLLADRRLADELGRNGRRLVETVYDYRSVCQEIDRVYESVRDTRSDRA